jgi:hypothetical protein
MRIVLFSAAGAFLVGCQDAKIPTPSDLDQVSRAIFDGTQEGGNERFFFLSPLVPQPSNSLFGVFDDLAQPTIEICPLIRQGSEWVCDEQDPPNPDRPEQRIVVRQFRPTEIDGRSDHYHAGWNTGGFDLGKYRVIVLIGSTNPGESVLRELGYRDIVLGDTGCGDETAPFLCVDPGSSLQIKFRIDLGAVCFGVEGCAGGTITDAAGAFLTNDENAIVVAGAGSLDPGQKVAIKFEEVSFPCVGYGVGEDFERLGLAQFPKCYKVTTFRDDPAWELQFLLTYSMCFEHDGLMINETAQSELVHLYRKSDDGDVLQVLARATTPEGFECIAPAPQLSLGERFRNLAFGMVEKLGTPLAPQPLLANAAMRRYHRGVTGQGGESTIGIALPAFLLEPASGPDLGVVAAGDPLNVTVLVKDEDLGPVRDNLVVFDPDAGSTFNGSASDLTVPTSSPNGTASGQWVLNTPGTHTLAASCLGCALAGQSLALGNNAGDGLPDGVDYAIGSTRATSLPVEIEFTATVIELSFETVPSGGTVEVPFLIRVCAGAPGVDIELTAINNNGTPEDLYRDGDTDPDPVVTTGDDGCVDVMVYLTKSGAVRLVATVELDGTIIDEETASKMNIRPAKK